MKLKLGWRHSGERKHRIFCSQPQVGDAFQYLGDEFRCSGIREFIRKIDTNAGKAGSLGSMLVWLGPCGQCGRQIECFSTGIRVPSIVRCAECKKNPKPGWHRARVRAGMAESRAQGIIDELHADRERQNGT